MRKPHLALPLVLALACGAGVLFFWTVTAPQATAQVGSSKSKRSAKSVNVKAIDVKATQVQQAFIKDAAELAKTYEDAGFLEKAKEMLGRIEAVSPDTPGVKEKLKQLNESILTSNEFDIDFDTSKGWGKPVAAVFKDRAFRIQAGGTYRFVTNLATDPEGFPTEEVTTDMASGIRCGALMGLIVSKGKPGKPFYVGTGQQLTPKEDGLLLLRVNAPPGSSCSGDLKIRLSGYVRGE